MLMPSAAEALATSTPAGQKQARWGSRTCPAAQNS